jgi:hypothetical protein
MYVISFNKIKHHPLPPTSVICYPIKVRILDLSSSCPCSEHSKCMVYVINQIIFFLFFIFSSPPNLAARPREEGSLL